MSDAFKDVSTVPTLTLEPFQAEEEKKPAVQPEEPKLDDTILTEEECRMVDAFAQQIDLTNSSMILQYGAGTQKDGRFLRKCFGKCEVKGSGRSWHTAYECCN